MFQDNLRGSLCFPSSTSNVKGTLVTSSFATLGKRADIGGSPEESRGTCKPGYAPSAGRPYEPETNVIGPVILILPLMIPCFSIGRFQDHSTTKPVNVKWP